MPAAWIGAATALYGATQSGGGGSTGGAGANMYVPTGLGQYDQNWQYNQNANQSQLNYGGGGGGANNGGYGGGYSPQQQAQPAPQQGGLVNYDSQSGTFGGAATPQQYFQSQGQTMQAPQANSAGYSGGGLAGLADPAIYNSFAQSQNIDYNPYLQASQQAGQQYGNLANQAGAAGNISYQQSQQGFGQQQNLQNMGNALWNTAQDPQNALYNQQYQQMQDQAGATASMYGLGSSAQGAGLQNQASQNFNTNWQNQQLGRELQGAQGASQLNSAGVQSGNQGSANLQAGMGYYGQQPGFTQQSAQVPLNAQQYAAAQPGINATTYASQIGQAMAPYTAQQNQDLSYMNYGSGAGSNAYANTLAQNKFNSQQQTAAGNALGNAAGGINWSQVGNWFSNPSNSGSAANSTDYYGGNAQAYP